MTSLTSRQIATFAGFDTPESLRTAVSRYNLPLKPYKVINGVGCYDRQAAAQAFVCGALIRLGVPVSRCARLLDSIAQQEDINRHQYSFAMFTDDAVVVNVTQKMEDLLAGV